MQHLARPFRRHAPRRRWGIAAAVAAALLAACGGSTSQYDPFVPQRLVSFGDESSALGDGTTAPRGANWSVNGLDAGGKLDCSSQRIWTQLLADNYGFVFPECNYRSVAEPQARSWARAGAKVADVAAQVDSAVRSGGVREGDLVTVLAGANDVIEIYRRYPASGDDADLRNALLSEAGARGKALAQVVNALVGQGAKVIVSNIPYIGYAPFAQAEEARNAGRAAFITQLAGAFNAMLGVNIILDGRYIGLVQIDQRTQAIGREPGSYNYANATGAVCAVALPDCTTATLVTDGSVTTWLWAVDVWLAPRGHAELGSMAIDRATRNPF
jgi:hypothetical protein